MTQHGSFPGRPRGRRARHQADGPEGEGYPTQDEREFPDLTPIRPSHARERDARDHGDWPGQPGQYGTQGQGGQPGQGGYDGGYQPGGPGYGQAGPGQAGPGYGGGQYGAGAYDAGQYGGGRHGGAQAPWPDQDLPQGFGSQPQPVQPQPVWSQPSPALQAQPAGSPQSQQGQSQWADAEQEGPDEDVPSWAEPASVEAFSARWHRRGLDSREDRRSGRRKHRRTLLAAGGAAVVAIAVAVYFLAFDNSSNSQGLGLGDLVTSFLPGEVQSIPDACGTVPSSTLSQYLPGTTKQAAPPLNSGTDSECSWTLDNPPTYRVLEAQIVAYTPSALVANPNGTGLVPAGNGSATYAAEAAFASFEYGLAKPSKSTGQPKATIANVAGMPGGNDTSAFSATQVFDKNGQVNDVATVYVRYRNVIVTAVVQGLAQSNGAKKYGPVSMSDLTAAATTVARQVTAKIV